MEKFRNLELRTMEFTKSVIRLCRDLPHDPITMELIKQVIRSSGSVGANYREANEKLSKKDFALRIKIARKEAKETTYWLELLQEIAPALSDRIALSVRESEELRNILSAILIKVNT